MKRRTFIVSLVTVAASLAGSVAFWRWRFPSGYRREAVPETLARFVDVRTIVKIGDSYRATHRQESQRDALERLISGPGDGSSNAGASIAERIAGDFRAGRIVQFHGWWLALTEARQCALFSVLYHD